MDEETQLSGILIRTGGKLECFWEGKNFGSVIPEELIDAELSTSKTCISKGVNDDGKKE